MHAPLSYFHVAVVVRVLTPLPSFFDCFLFILIEKRLVSSPRKAFQKNSLSGGVLEKMVMTGKFFWEKVTYIGKPGGIQVEESLMVCLLVIFDRWFFPRSLFFP